MNLLAIHSIEFPWYADIANYLVTGKIPMNLSKDQKLKFTAEAKFYLWDDPLLFCIGADQIIKRCVTDYEIPSVISFCHSEACGGHFLG